MTINKHHTHHNFLGTHGFRYLWCVAISGMPGDYSYFAPVPKYYLFSSVPKVTRNFLSLFELFEVCFVLRQRKTSTVPIEFSKEVKYSTSKYAKRGNQLQIKHLRQKQHEESFFLNRLRRKRNNKKKSPAAQWAENNVRPRRNRPIFFFRLRRECGPVQYFSFFARCEKRRGTEKA